jgi:predicted outer membrane repeat protein
MRDSLVIGGDATGSTASAGAMRIVFESIADVDTTTFAGNKAALYGGAIYAAGTTIDFDAIQLFDNEISPGVAESETQSFGAAIFSAPVENAFGNPSRDLPVSGSLSGSTVSRNVGMPLYEDDRNPQPINAVQYFSNTFNNTTFGSNIYRHGTAQSHTAAELNQLIIPHSGVNKGSGNTWSSRPDLGALLAAPPRILNETAVGDTQSSTKAYLGYAWDSAGSATLDGSPVSGGIGWGETSVGTHTLSVDGNVFQDSVGQGPTPAVIFTATPAETTPGQPVTLAWTVTSGTFLGVEIDQGLSVNPAPNGQIIVNPTVTTTYSLHAITEEGGVTAQATVCVNCESPLFEDGFETGNVSRWSSAVTN